MAGIEDVAKLAGVSTATVSRALSGKNHVSAKAQAKVLAAANELGYTASHSAYTLATGRNRNVGVVMPYLDRWFFSAILEETDSKLIDNGYDLTLYNLSGGQHQRESQQRQHRYHASGCCGRLSACTQTCAAAALAGAHRSGARPCAHLPPPPARPPALHAPPPGSPRPPPISPPNPPTLPPFSRSCRAPVAPILHPLFAAAQLTGNRRKMARVMMPSMPSLPTIRLSR